MKIIDLLHSKRNEKVQEGTFPYLEISDIDVNSKKYSFKDKTSVLGAVYAHENNILVSTVRPTRGAITIVKENEIPVSNAFAILNVNDKICLPKYLFYSINNKVFLDYLGKNSKGATYPTCSKEDIYNYNINYVDYSRQNEIVTTFDNISRQIEIKTNQLSDYDQLIKSRFVEMFGDLTQNSGSWNRDYLGNLLTIVRGASPRPIQSYITEEENGINWIKIGDTLKDSMFITSTKEKINPEGVAKSRFVKEGDFLLSNSMSFGRPYILKTSGCVHDGWLVLSNYETSFNKYFLYSLLNSEAVYNQFKSIVVGGVVNNLNSEMVRNLKVIIPPMDIQIKFSEILEQVDKLKFAVQQSLNETQQLFDSLMQEYFG